MAYDYSLPTEDYHQIYRFLEISQNDFNQKEISKLKKHFGKLFGAPTLFDFREQVSCTQHDSNRWTVKRSLPVNSFFLGGSAKVLPIREQCISQKFVK